MSALRIPRAAGKKADRTAQDASIQGPTLVSLFTGAGGLDIGLEQAGFRTVAAVDNDPHCIETLNLNRQRGVRRPDGQVFLEEAAIIHGDVTTLTADDLKSQGSLRGRPTLMAGGPPCQPFSSSGKMLSLADPRGRLFEHYVRLADELAPDFILFENVRGLVTAKGPCGKPGEALVLVKRAFEDIGYATSFHLLNAADFGCPQRRVRLFMFGTRQHVLPEFPEPTHSETPSESLFTSVLPWVPLQEVLDPNPEPGDIVRPTNKLAPQLAELDLGSGLKSAGARETTRPGGHWGYRQGTFVSDPTRPARTVTASPAQDWIRLADGSHRRLTWRECARLQGFPEEWILSGGRDDKYRQIGNAVPVVLGKALGRAILESLRREQAAHQLVSAPLPPSFSKAVVYTIKENARNGESRQIVREMRKSKGAAAHQLKGLGRGLS